MGFILGWMWYLHKPVFIIWKNDKPLLMFGDLFNKALFMQYRSGLSNHTSVCKTVTALDH